MTSKRLHLWESALLLAFSLTLITGVWASGSQSALADRVVRLHVIANSDSDADQALKLQVRDGVLSAAGDCLDGVTDRTQAEAILSQRLQALADAGAAVVAQAGYDYPVTVSLEDCWFPTKEYDDFSLPAGTYRALRVVIGEGRGQNWWCVVFPPLCLGSVTETTADAAAMAGLTDNQIALITGQDQEYVIKFKIVEWWNSLGN
jgi:stage II sporulation protein R